MRELLTQAAEAYSELMRFQYTFLLGHKGRAETLVLSFPAESFHHVAGLHKLGLARIKNKKYAIDYLLLEGLPEDLIIPDSIISRLTGIIHLQEMIESNNLVFRIRESNFPGSQIVADYLIQSLSHLFFIKDGKPVTVFSPQPYQSKQAERCLKLTTLRIVRTDLYSGEQTEIFKSPSYKPE